jgi:hypothetical protein
MAPVSDLYVAFFLVSLFVLFLIFCVKAPELWRSCRLFSRQMVARRTREERMLADLEKLMAEARRLEGIYCFESIETNPPSVHHVEPKVSGAVPVSAKKTESQVEAMATT